MHSRPDADPSLLMSTPGERRAAMQRLEQERADARRRELDEQTSVNNLPQERIRIWERLHALALPRSETHPLVRVIAAQTNLSVRDVREEQQRRSDPSRSDPSRTERPST